ncbi:hypothetical protein FACS1894217_13810 [Clostridia bacterium]|nr:hypothetical protein FACS1894217_13810 [Clostridia bacterium]
MKIIESILTKNDCYTSNRQIAVQGLMLHSVGCSQPSATVFVNNWNTPKPNGIQVCVHGFIDGNSGDVYKTLPWNWRGWHCGGNGNNTHIGVEMCEPSTITYTGGASWTDKNPENTKAVVLRTYKSAVELFASLCKEFSLDPTKDGVIISHKEGCARGIASNHGDPEHLWGKFGLTMNQFRADVKVAMGATPLTPTPEPPKTDALYRVQTGAFGKKDYAERLQAELKAKGYDTFIAQIDGYYKVQVGAYSVKANADAMLAKLKAAGYDAFITTNNQAVAPTPAKPALKSIEEIAKEVINGNWGNGQERKDRLTAAGYDYATVQAKVNALLK